MQVRTKSVLRLDFQRVLRRRETLASKLEQAKAEADRLSNEISRCDAEITQISNEYDELVGYEHDGAPLAQL
jgi:uncharacterized coiled-coil DUF342 family protein